MIGDIYQRLNDQDTSVCTAKATDQRSLTVPMQMLNFRFSYKGIKILLLMQCEMQVPWYYGHIQL